MPIFGINLKKIIMVKFIKELLDRLQTSNPKWFRILMIICALISFFILADQQFDFVNLGKYEAYYGQILGYLAVLFGFSWLPNDDKKPKKLFGKNGK